MREPAGQEENLKEHPCFRKKGIYHKKRNLEVAIREQRGGQGGREVRKAWGTAINCVECRREIQEGGGQNVASAEVPGVFRQARSGVLVKHVCGGSDAVG